MHIDIKQEGDGRWLTEIPDLPGVMVYGSTREEAVARMKALAQRVLGDRLEPGETLPELVEVLCDTDERHSPVGLTSNFTPRTQQVLALARKEAERFHHNFVGTEHLLLGLVRLGQGTAVTVLGKMGLDLETVRVEVERQVGTGPDQKVIGEIPYTPRVKRILALAAKEARALNHSHVGTEHILLGLLIEGDGVAARVLKSFKVDTQKTRLELLRELDPNATLIGKDASENAPHLGSVDTRKRYDVYCWERNQQLVVYRHALFKSRSKLLASHEDDFGAEFLELEQSNGQTVYLSLPSVLRFCEPGAELVGEIVSPP